MDFYEHDEDAKAAAPMEKIRGLMENGFSLKSKIDERKIELEGLEDELHRIEAELLPMLEGAKMEQVAVEGLGKILVDQKISVKVPKDPEAKAAFFEYLKARGIFDGMATVHSATLNAFYNDELEAKAAIGEEVKIPGLEPSGKYSRLKWKR